MGGKYNNILRQIEELEKQMEKLSSEDKKKKQSKAKQSKTKQ